MNGAVGITTGKAEKGLDQGKNPGPRRRAHFCAGRGGTISLFWKAWDKGQKEEGRLVQVPAPTTPAGPDDLEVELVSSGHGQSSSRHLRGCSTSSHVHGLVKSQCGFAYSLCHL